MCNDDFHLKGLLFSLRGKTLCRLLSVLYHHTHYLHCWPVIHHSWPQHEKILKLQYYSVYMWLFNDAYEHVCLLDVCHSEFTADTPSPS